MTENKEELKKFVLDTLLPYFEDPSTCAFRNGNCVYVDTQGNKCALGKHLKPGPWMTNSGDAVSLFISYEMSDILTEKAYSIVDDMDVWTLIQDVHDELASMTKENSSYVTRKTLLKSIESLEYNLQVDLSELKKYCA